MHALEEKLLYIFSFIPYSPGIVLPWFITICISLFLFVLNWGWKPGEDSKKQVFGELIYSSVKTLVEFIVGEEHSERLLPVLSSVFIYISLANLIGLVPGLKAPTSIFSNCLGMALIIFFYTIYLGINTHGFGYIKHFTGKIWWMAPLMFPIHLIGEISHPISLSLRLFGNVLGEEIVILVLTVALFPLLIPVPMMLMGIFTSLLQALVFTILSGIYLSGAIEEGH